MKTLNLKKLNKELLEELLDVLEKQLKIQEEWLVSNLHLRLTDNEEYIVEDRIYNDTFNKITKVKLRIAFLNRKEMK